MNPIRVLILLCASVGIGCSNSSAAPPKKAGELVLAIDSDMSPGIDFDRFQIEIRQQGAPVALETFKEFGQPGQELRFPATKAIVSNGKATTQIQLRIVTGMIEGGGNPDVGAPQNLVEFVTSVPTDRSAMKRVHVEWLCRHSTKLEADNYVEGTCPEGSACLAGECVDWNVDAKSLPTYSESDIFGGGSANGEGNCFDTLGCFSGAAAVALDAQCTFAAKDVDKLNVALVPAKGYGGICAGDACFVPLDRDDPSGWTEDTGRVQVPPKVCKLLKQPEEDLHLRGVVATTKCESKTPRIPTCGPWSIITSTRGATTADPPKGLP
jgi:hypothetical protein